MQCPNCKKENKVSNCFCIYCGATLPVPEQESTPKSEQISADDNFRQLQILREEVHRLREASNRLNERLSVIENIQRPTLAPSELKPEKPTVKTSEPIVLPSPTPAKEKKTREWEQILGGNWLARIGALALVIGIAFFLKMAFDNNWIGPLVRVIMGTVGGLAMLGWGYFWRKRYPVLSQTINGGGIAVLYISFFAAFAAFHLIPFYVSVILLFIVSGASAILATRYNSMGLAILGIIGAFLAPIILGYSSAAGVANTAGSQAIQLMIYVFIVDIGVLVLSTFRNWRWFTLLALISSLIVFGGWYGRFHSNITLLTSEVSLTVIFLIFVGATTLFHIIRRESSHIFDYALMVIAAAAYFGISYGLMRRDLQPWLGGFSFLLALFYGGLAYITYKRTPKNSKLFLFPIGIAVVFLTVAIPIQLGDKAWTTISWAAEVVVLIWLAAALRLPLLRYFGYAAAVVMAGRLIFFDTAIIIRHFTPILNERFLAFIPALAALSMGAFLLKRDKENLPEKKTSVFVFITASIVLLLWLFSFEIWGYFEHYIQMPSRLGYNVNALRNAQNLSLTALWAVYAVALLVIGILKRWRLIRVGGLMLLTITIIKVFAYDVFTLERVYRIIAFISLGVLLLVSAYLYHRYSKAIKGFLTK